VITLQFLAAGTDWSSGLIAWFGGGPAFSHVDVVLADGTLLGAREQGGVAIRPHDYFGSSATLRIDVPATDEEYSKFWDFVDQQIGKPYDTKAILAFVTGRDWRDPNAWFCSELVAAALEAAGIVNTLAAPANKITPPDLVLVLSAIIPIKI
jgi:uncharacterized protein YycO